MLKQHMPARQSFRNRLIKKKKGRRTTDSFLSSVEQNLFRGGQSATVIGLNSTLRNLAVARADQTSANKREVVHVRRLLKNAPLENCQYGVEKQGDRWEKEKVSAFVF